MSLVLDLVYVVLGLVTAPIWARRARGGWAERFAWRVDVEPPSGDRPRLLLHAVSVGEVNLLAPLVDALGGEVDIVVSTTTDTGIARARATYAGRAQVVRYPLDFSRSVRRFLDAVRPDAVALVELELWPNFVRACRRRGIPIGVVNGRMSARSFRGYRRLRLLLRPLFRALAFAAVQDETYAERFRAMGVAGDRCHVCGTMKWDAAVGGVDAAVADELATSLGIDRTRSLVVLGSAGPDESALLHALPALTPPVQLLSAPRRPEWFAAAARAMPGCVRRSTGAGDPASGRFLLDTIGELRAAYALADVAVVGRSFGGLHGSDPMEPAALGRPVVIGPAYDDFSTIVETMCSAGAIRVAAADALDGVLSELLGDAEARAEIGRRAAACVRAQQGAAARHATLLRGILAGDVG